MTRKILVLGCVGECKSALMLQAMKEAYGNDIVLITPEEANEHGLKPEDFANIPSYKLTAPPIFEDNILHRVEKSGKEKRRERRAKERRSNMKPR